MLKVKHTLVWSNCTVLGTHNRHFIIYSFSVVEKYK